MELRFPREYFGMSLPGLFAILGTVAALSLGLIAMFITLLLALPFAGIIGFVSSAAGAVHDAERAETLTVQDRSELPRVVASITERSRRVFAPRLVVLRVAHTTWQEAVSRLATITAVSIIDMSEVTENVAWELSELEHFSATVTSSSVSTSRFCAGSSRLSMCQHLLLWKSVSGSGLRAATSWRKRLTRLACGDSHTPSAACSSALTRRRIPQLPPRPTPRTEGAGASRWPRW